MATVLRILFDGLDDRVVDADVRVILEDVSEAGAPAPVLGRWHFPQRSVTPEQPTLEIDIDPEPADAAEASVRVHVDLDGSGRITRGDFISTSIAVLPDPPPTTTARPGPGASPPARDVVPDARGHQTIVIHVERV